MEGILRGTLHLRLPDGRLFFFGAGGLAGACQFGTAWVGLRLNAFIHNHPRRYCWAKKLVRSYHPRRC